MRYPFVKFAAQAEESPRPQEARSDLEGRIPEAGGLRRAAENLLGVDWFGVSVRGFEEAAIRLANEVGQ